METLKNIGLNVVSILTTLEIFNLVRNGLNWKSKVAIGEVIIFIIAYSTVFILIKLVVAGGWEEIREEIKKKS